jgi:hypothetical protein
MELTRMSDITFITIPKPFLDETEFERHISTIQRKALETWFPLGNVWLFGNDPGVAQVAHEYDLPHMTEIPYNGSGTPYVFPVFDLAERFAKTEFICYVNTDILLPPSFGRLAEVAPANLVMASGQRCDIDTADVPEIDGGWEERLLAPENNIPMTLHGPQGFDFFLYRRGVFWPWVQRQLMMRCDYDAVMQIAVGRYAWDNLLAYWARSMADESGGVFLNATGAVYVYHQNHERPYTNSVGEITWNRAVVGHRVFTLGHATHELNEAWSVVERS